jgi:hypothetical protein
LSWVAGLELDEEFECGLIRLLFKASSHLFPMVPEDIGTSTTRFVAEPTIGLGPNDDAACSSRLAPETDPLDERFVLFAGKPTWKLNAQLFEELHGVDGGEFLQSAAYDRPRHAERLDTGVARLGVNRLRLLVHFCGCRGLVSMENVRRISPACQALDRLATNAARLGGSDVVGGGVSPFASAARCACTARISSNSFSGSRPAAMSRSVLLVAIGILSACRRRSQGVCGG